MDFIRFWLVCLSKGFKFSFETFGAIDGVCILITAALYWTREHHQKFWEKKGEPFVKKYALVIIAAQFVLGVCLVAPFVQFKSEKGAKEIALRSLEDKSPKLHGFVNRMMIADEPRTTNSLIFLEVTVGNSGGSASLADEYGLKVILSKTSSTNAEAVNFSDEFKINFWDKGKFYLLDLKRPELISERTHKAIQSGESPRGWIAFRLIGIPMSRYSPTNIILSFLDINDNKIYVTNGISREKSTSETISDPISVTMPGSDNIFYPVAPTVETNTGWQPPELPPGCSNITVFFGAQGFITPRLMAEISPEQGGTKFLIKDLPDFFLQNLDKIPNYSPRNKYMWIRESMSTTVGGKTVPYPIQPIIVSNRLYVEVQIPFLNEKRKIVMSDSFDPELPIPHRWDRNYSTNYDANGGIYFYEVVNELTNPVLQVFYTAPNEVHVYGIFKVDAESTLVSFGQPPQLLTFSNKVIVGLECTQRVTTVSLQSSNFSETLAIYTNDSIASIGEMFTNEFYRPIFPGQRAVFKYPSNRNNIGAFADWFVEIEKIDTKTVGKPQ